VLPGEGELLGVLLGEMLGLALGKGVVVGLRIPQPGSSIKTKELRRERKTKRLENTKDTSQKTDVLF